MKSCCQPFSWVLMSLMLLLWECSPLHAQNIVWLYPTEDAVTTSQLPANNWGGHIQLSAYAWTQGGQFCRHRSYLKFDYQHLSLGRPLIRATLHLKFFDPLGYPNSGANHLRIGVCDTNWSEYQINWLNQPEAIPGLQIDVPPSSGFQDLSIDVLPLVLYQYHNSNTGMVIRLVEEFTYRMVQFGSRENEGYIPELELEFLDISTRCDTFSAPGSLDLVQLNSSAPQSSLINPFEFSVGSIPGQNFNVKRAYFKPDLSRLPPSINLLYANLRLLVYNDQQIPNAGNTALSIHPLNQSAAINSINWSNQPSFTSLVSSHSLAPEANFGAVNFDMKALLERSLTTGQNNGFVIKQQNESMAGMSHFAGTGFSVSTGRPTLLVCYSLNSAASSLDRQLDLQLYPNPAKEEVRLAFSTIAGQPLRLYIHDMQGRLVYDQMLTEPLSGSVELKLSTAELANGVYTLGVLHGQKQAFEKLVVAH